MAYEIYDRKVKYRGDAAITITKFGQLAFNKSAADILQKEAVESVLLLWDNERRSVGIRSIKKKDPRAFTVRWSKRGDGASFTIASFIRHIEYNASESRAFPVKWDEQEQMFEFKIEQKFHIKGGHVTPMRRKIQTEQ